MLTKRKTLFLLFIVTLAAITAALLRLTLYSDAASKYSDDSNKQLQSRASELVKNTRELADSFYKKDRELLVDYQKNHLSREQYANNLKQANDSTVSAYKEKLLPESKAVRTELHRRLPPRVQHSNVTEMYEKLSIVMEIQIIADDLDLLSKSLPDAR